MNKSEDNNLELKRHKLEKDYWWFVARRDMILRLIKNLDKNSKILDIGCSGGVFIQFLKENGFKNVYGIDISRKAIKTCKEKNIENVFVMDAGKAYFKNDFFDVVIASDILEHTDDDYSNLLEWKRILKKNGKIIIFVPAYNSLWTKWDEDSDHYRRYSKKSLINILKKTDLKIKRLSYWNFCSFLPVSFMKIFNFYKADFYILNPFINKLFINLLKFENFMLKKINYPFGISIFIIATKIE